MKDVLTFTRRRFYISVHQRFRASSRLSQRPFFRHSATRFPHVEKRVCGPTEQTAGNGKQTVRKRETDGSETGCGNIRIFHRKHPMFTSKSAALSSGKFRSLHPVPPHFPTGFYHRFQRRFPHLSDEFPPTFQLKLPHDFHIFPQIFHTEIRTAPRGIRPPTDKEPRTQAGKSRKKVRGWAKAGAEKVGNPDGKQLDTGPGTTVKRNR